MPEKLEGAGAAVVHADDAHCVSIATLQTERTALRPPFRLVISLGS
jgi:hypothetical protein